MSKADSVKKRGWAGRGDILGPPGAPGLSAAPAACPPKRDANRFGPDSTAAAT